MRSFRLAAAILAGGQSRRFGADKTAALLSGQTLLDRAIDNMGRFDCPVWINHRPGQTRPGHVTLPDLRDDAGPLAGIEAILLHGQNHAYSHIAVMPADIPFLPAFFAERMQEAAQAAPDHIHYAAPDGMDAWLCAIWPVALLPALSRWLDDGERKTRLFLNHHQARPVVFHAAECTVVDFCNINTADALETIAKLVSTDTVSP